jgi:hypothetical protein
MMKEDYLFRTQKELSGNHMSNNYILSWFEKRQKVIKRPWWKFWDKDLTKSYWVRRQYEVNSRLGEFILKNQDEFKEILCMIFSTIWGLQLESIPTSTPYITTSGHSILLEDSKTNFIKNTTTPDE